VGPIRLLLHLLLAEVEAKRRANQRDERGEDRLGEHSPVETANTDEDQDTTDHHRQERKESDRQCPAGDLALIY